MAALLRPHSIDKHSRHLVNSPPGLQCSTFALADFRSVRMLYHTSSPALKATIVAFMRTQGCASGVLDEHVPPPSSDAFNTLLATALAAASISDTRPVIAQTVTRVASSPLSPKRRANVNLLQEFSSTPSPGKAALQESHDSDGEAEAIDGESFSPARPDDTTDAIIDVADAPATMDPVLKNI